MGLNQCNFIYLYLIYDSTLTLGNRYRCFDLQSPSDSFKLSLGPGSYIKEESNISDAMIYHDGQPFSTHDNDNDATSIHCAKQSQVNHT